MVSIHAPVRERLHPKSFHQRFYVSMHAPMRERQDCCGALWQWSVSIHAPVRERRRLPKQCTILTTFQFTLPWGSDSVYLVVVRWSKSFNSRSREGATCNLGAQSIIDYVSIHAPVRERPFLQPLWERERGFNSRSREGATLWSPSMSRP